MTGRLRAAGCVFAEEEARLLVEEAGTATELDAMVDARTGGEPLEYVLGWAGFCGLRIAVEPGVFVPRRRTEFLVDRAVSRLLASRPGPDWGGRPVVVLDICCGTGALGLAAAHRLHEVDLHAVDLHAVDVDPVAVECARRNLAATTSAAAVYEGDLFAPLPLRLRGRADVVLANVPYVPTQDVALLPAEARDHEARIALDGGTDGLDVLRRVAAEVPPWLAPTGFILVETSRAQAPSAVDAFRVAGLAAEVLTSDDRDDADDPDDPDDAGDRWDPPATVLLAALRPPSSSPPLRREGANGSDFPACRWRRAGPPAAGFT